MVPGARRKTWHRLWHRLGTVLLNRITGGAICCAGAYGYSSLDQVADPHSEKAQVVEREPQLRSVHTVPEVITWLEEEAVLQVRPAEGVAESHVFVARRSER